MSEWRPAGVFLRIALALVVVLASWGPARAARPDQNDIDNAIKNYRIQAETRAVLDPDAAFQNAIAVKLAKSFGKALNAVFDASKDADDFLLTTFLININTKSNNISEDYFEKLAKLSAQDLDNHNLRAVSAVALFTMETPRKIDPTTGAPLPRAGAQWVRTDVYSPVYANTTTNWNQIDRDYLAFETAAQAADAGTDDPTAEFYPDAASVAAAAKLTEQEWLARLESRLTRIYQGRGGDIDPLMIKDLARIEYLMRGLTQQAAGAVAAGARFLRPLDAALAKTPAGAREQALEDALSAMEKKHGFDREVLTAVSILSGPEFSESVRGGYRLDDLGAGRLHGSQTHRLQWYAIVAAYDDNPDNFNYPPLKLFTEIGRLDVERARSLAVGQAGRSIWAFLLDLDRSNAVQKEFSHPDDVRPLLQEAGLSNLYAVFQQEYTRRDQEATKLLNSLVDDVAAKLDNLEVLGADQINSLKMFQSLVNAALNDSDRQRLDTLITSYNLNVGKLGSQNLSPSDREAAQGWAQRTRTFIGDQVAIYNLLSTSVLGANRPLRWASIDGQSAGFLVRKDNLAPRSDVALDLPNNQPTVEIKAQESRKVSGYKLGGPAPAGLRSAQNDDDDDDVNDKVLQRKEPKGPTKIDTKTPGQIDSAPALPEQASASAGAPFAKDDQPAVAVAGPKTENQRKQKGSSTEAPALPLGVIDSLAFPEVSKDSLALDLDKEKSERESSEPNPANAKGSGERERVKEAAFDR